MINRFAGEYAFLSNFYRRSFWGQPFDRWRGDDALTLFRTAEHCFQANKAVVVSDFFRVAAELHPKEAKAVGRRIYLRPDWDDVRLDVMTYTLGLKFSDPVLAKKLVDTGSQELIEGNTWGDTFWGVCRGEGSNHLGRLLMDLRRHIARETQ